MTQNSICSICEVSYETYLVIVENKRESLFMEMYIRDLYYDDKNKGLCRFCREKLFKKLKGSIKENG